MSHTSGIYTELQICLLFSLSCLTSLQIEGQSSAPNCNLVFVFKSEIFYLQHKSTHAEGQFDILTKASGVKSLYTAVATTAVLGDGLRGDIWNLGDKFEKNVLTVYPTCKKPCDEDGPDNDWKAYDNARATYGTLLGSLHHIKIDDTLPDNCTLKYGAFINPIYVTLSVTYKYAAECYRDYDFYYRKLQLNVAGMFYEQTKSRCHWVYQYDGIEEYDSATAADDDPPPTVVICKTKDSLSDSEILDPGCVLKFHEPNYENTIYIDEYNELKSRDPDYSATQKIRNKRKNEFDFKVNVDTDKFVGSVRTIGDPVKYYLFVHVRAIYNVTETQIHDVASITIKLIGPACVGPNIPEMYVDTLSAIERTDNVFRGCKLDSWVLGFQGNYSLDLAELDSTGIVIMTNDDTSSKKVQFFSGLLKFTFQEKEHYVKTSFHGHLCLGPKEYRVNDDIIIRKPDPLEHSENV